jgi:predicted DNA-binding protein (MmcQ/YjbR family)
MKNPRTFSEAEAILRKAGMAYPAVTEDFPWGHRTLKVKGKAFIFMSREGGEFSLSVKLPESNPLALSMPFASPTGYGLGRSGWVTAAFARPAEVPIALLLAWLEESYRAVAPKRLGASLPAPGAAVLSGPRASGPRGRGTRRRGAAGPR